MTRIPTSRNNIKALWQKMKEVFATKDHEHDLSIYHGVLGVESGGTGCTSVSELKELLGLEAKRNVIFQNGTSTGSGSSRAELVISVIDGFLDAVTTIYVQRTGMYRLQMWYAKKQNGADDEIKLRTQNGVIAFVSPSDIEQDTQVFLNEGDQLFILTNGDGYVSQALINITQAG